MTYWLDYAIVGFCRVLLEKVGDFAFGHWGSTVSLSMLPLRHSVHYISFKSALNLLKTGLFRLGWS